MKSQIWSPEQIKAQGEFVGFRAMDVQSLSRFTELSRQDSVSSAARPTNSHTDKFRMASEYWDGLMNDPLFRERFESSVENEVRARLLRRLDSQESQGIPAISQEAMKRVYQENQNLGMSNLEEQIDKVQGQLAQTWQEKLESLDKNKADAVDTLNRLMSEWKNQREGLLHSHEREWCQTMIHLLQRFQVEKGDAYGKALETWMNQAIPDFVSKNPVKIIVGPADWEALKASVGKTENGEGWIIVQDPSLKSGQIRFEAGEAGAIFDAPNNYEKLFQWLETVR